MQSGDLVKHDSTFAVETGNFISSADDVKKLVVGINQQQPVYLEQIATVEDGAATPDQYVFFGYGKQKQIPQQQTGSGQPTGGYVISCKNQVPMHALVTTDHHQSGAP